MKRQIDEWQHQPEDIDEKMKINNISNRLTLNVSKQFILNHFTFISSKTKKCSLLDRFVLLG
jgi:hypothetical protein